MNKPEPSKFPDTLAGQVWTELWSHFEDIENAVSGAKFLLKNLAEMVGEYHSGKCDPGFTAIAVMDYLDGAMNKYEKVLEAQKQAVITGIPTEKY